MKERIIIVEDEALIAEEIKSTLTILGYQVVGHAMNGDKALDLLASTPADLYLLDINIKGTVNGIDLAKVIISKYNAPHVFLTSFSDQLTLEEVKKVEPYGYILKPFNKNDLRVNIELAFAKYRKEKKKKNNAKGIIEQAFHITLTNREYDILSYFIQGSTYKEVAESLEISINTVKTYQKRLFNLFKVKSKVELIVLFSTIKY